MTHEEILSIEEYCAEHKISHKKRLEELGIPFWSFYKAKQKYRRANLPEQFIQLALGRYAPYTMPPARTAGKSTAGKRRELSHDRVPDTYQYRNVYLGRDEYYSSERTGSYLQSLSASKGVIEYSLLTSRNACGVDVRARQEENLRRIHTEKHCQLLHTTCRHYLQKEGINKPPLTTSRHYLVLP